MLPTEMEGQVAEALRLLRVGNSYERGMAIFVTPLGLKWTQPETPKWRRLMLQLGPAALAGIYDRRTQPEWVMADVAATVRGLGVA